MITFDRVSVTYAGSDRAVLRDVTVRIEEGELCLVVGPTGSGKSTFLGAIDGLVPHFTGGTLTGTVTVDGRDTRTHPPRELADVVGYVGQDPVAGLRDRCGRGGTRLLDGASGARSAGHAQARRGDPGPARPRRPARPAAADPVGRAAAARRDRRRPDRPPTGARARRTHLGPRSDRGRGGHRRGDPARPRPRHDRRAWPSIAWSASSSTPTRSIRVAGDGTVTAGAPGAVLAAVADVPPIVGLARWPGWEPMPLSIRDARRLAPALRERLAAVGDRGPATGRGAGERPGRRRLVARGISVRTASVVAVRSVDLALPRRRRRRGHGPERLRQVVAAVGAPGVRAAPRRDGGRRRPRSGRPGAGRRATARRARPAGGAGPAVPRDRRRRVPPGRHGVRGDRAGTCRGLLDRLVPGIPGDATRATCRRASGWRSSWPIQLTATPAIVLLDEPTRGLDYAAKRQLAATLRCARGGRALDPALDPRRRVRGDRRRPRPGHGRRRDRRRRVGARRPGRLAGVRAAGRPDPRPAPLPDRR